MDSLEKVSLENEILEFKTLGGRDILSNNQLQYLRISIVPCTSVCGRVSLAGALDLSVPLLAEVLSLYTMREQSL